MGVKIRDDTTLIVQEKVEYESAVFEPGDWFEVDAIEFAAPEETLTVWIDGAPLDVLDWSAFVRHVERGEFVVAVSDE